MNGKNFGLPASFYGQGCANCFRPVNGFILRFLFEKKVRYILSFSHNEQTLFGSQSKILQQGCQKKLSKFLIISGHWAKSFLFFVEKIVAVLPKLHSTCLQEQFEWNFPLKKVFSFFHILFGQWAKKIGFLSTFYDGFSKSVFYISMGTFRRKMFAVILFRLSILFGL